MGGRKTRAGDDVCSATEKLHAVGSDEVVVFAVSESRGFGGRIGFHLRMGEKQFCSYLIGPGAAEDLVLIGDERVGGVEAEDLSSLGGKGACLGAVEGAFILID